MLGDLLALIVVNDWRENESVNHPSFSDELFVDNDDDNDVNDENGLMRRNLVSVGTHMFVCPPAAAPSTSDNLNKRDSAGAGLSLLLPSLLLSVKKHSRKLIVLSVQEPAASFVGNF